jgi:hypothetical protein
LTVIKKRKSNDQTGKKRKKCTMDYSEKNLSFSIFCTSSYNLSRYLVIDMKLIVLGSFPPIRQPPRSQKKKKKKKNPLILIAYTGNSGKLIDNHRQVEITRGMIDWN